MKGLNPMTQANRVHSTPRRTASKIKAQPAAAQQDLVSSMTIIQQPTTEDRIRIDASRAHAYCGLESQVTECFLAAEVGDCCRGHVVGRRAEGHRRSGNGCDARCLSIGGRRPSSSCSI